MQQQQQQQQRQGGLGAHHLAVWGKQKAAGEERLVCFQKLSVQGTRVSAVVQPLYIDNSSFFNIFSCQCQRTTTKFLSSVTLCLDSLPFFADDRAAPSPKRLAKVPPLAITVVSANIFTVVFLHRRADVVIVVFLHRRAAPSPSPASALPRCRQQQPVGLPQSVCASWWLDLRHKVKPA
jgi:hypothetical protein